jgi:hypothetical protein
MTATFFTSFRQPGRSDEKFAADAYWVRRDLMTLKTRLEAHLPEDG